MYLGAPRDILFQDMLCLCLLQRFWPAGNMSWFRLEDCTMNDIVAVGFHPCHQLSI